MTNLLKRFAKDESGATAVEYGLVAAGISVAIIAVMQGLGSKLNTTVQSAFKSATAVSLRRQPPIPSQSASPRETAASPRRLAANQTARSAI
jgi:pilus assembly protein Flp/PilA